MKISHLVVAVLCVAVVSGCASVGSSRDVLYQTSTISALMQGVYDGDVTVARLLRHGDTGLGTFNTLDGEMVCVDGVCYQVKADGKAVRTGSDMQTPFAVVTFFDVDELAHIDKVSSLKELEERLDAALANKNIFYAFKIEGLFDYVKTRSVPPQQKPYRLLVDVVKDQPTFDFTTVEGVIVGFRCPAYVSGVNVAGYHMHFITKDRTAGGHLLDCRMHDVNVGFDATRNFFLRLPKNGEFAAADLSASGAGDVQKVEK